MIDTTRLILRDYCEEDFSDICEIDASDTVQKMRGPNSPASYAILRHEWDNLSNS